MKTENKTVGLKGRYSYMTVQQLEILANLLRLGWENKTTERDNDKGKVSLKRGKWEVKFEYINTSLRDKSGSILFWTITLSEEQLELIYSI